VDLLQALDTASDGCFGQRPAVEIISALQLKVFTENVRWLSKRNWSKKLSD
jgi:hypothetical protein